MIDMIDDVTEFTSKFNLPISDVIAYPDTDRMNLIAEEYDELLIAYARGDLPGVLDGLVDLTYVIIGSAVQAKLPFEKAWILVHQANMRKERGERDPTSTSTDCHQRIIKPKGWIGPNHGIEELIRDAINKS